MSKQKKKDQIINDIKEAKSISTKRRNTMGTSERFYNPYFLLKSFKSVEELENLTEKELNLLLQFADFAADIFY